MTAPERNCNTVDVTLNPGDKKKDSVTLVARFKWCGACPNIGERLPYTDHNAIRRRTCQLADVKLHSIIYMRTPYCPLNKWK